MNFEYHIYQYLLKHKKAEVPGFGVFELSKESAKIDAENSIIIPPKELIIFQYLPTVFDNQLAKYIAEETNSNLFTIQTDLKNEIAQWYQKLNAEKILELENLGQFQYDDQNKIVKISDNTDAIFGLEAINLKALGKTSTKKNTNHEDYTFSKNVFWTFLSLIVLGTAALFLFGDQQAIFGKSSQIPTKKIAKKKELIKPFAIPKQDSIKKDSIKSSTTNAKIQKINR